MTGTYTGDATGSVTGHRTGDIQGTRVHYSEVVNTGIKSDDGTIFEGDRDKVVIGDLDKAGSYLVVTSGGRGGVGNSAYAKSEFIPEIIAKAAEKSKGTLGDIAYLELELKFIADIGLVGKSKCILCSATSRIWVYN